MNLLYLCHRIPYPPDKGDKIRSYNQVRYLGARHSVSVVCFADEHADRARGIELARDCASVDVVFRGRSSSLARAAAGLPSGRSMSVAAFGSGSMRRTLRRVVERGRFDAALVFSSQMGQYLDVLPPVPCVVDFVDVDSEKWRDYAARLGPPRSWLYRLEAKRLSDFEGRLARRAARSVFVSEAEAALFLARHPGMRVSVLSMGVDLDYFAPGPEGATPGQPPTAVFVGMMDYRPNVDAVSYFAREILPRVRRRVADACFRVVGRRPTAAVRALAALPGVAVTGAVPDVRPHLRDAAVSVAPFRIARGIQSKTLEAMAMGLPVVGTSIAFQGIASEIADGVSRKDAPEDFAEEVALLMRSPELQRSRGALARRYVERQHRWEDRGRELESLLSEAVHEGRPTPPAE